MWEGNGNWDRVRVQGVSGLDGFFEFDISDTYNTATVLYLGSNWPQLNDIW